MRLLAIDVGMGTQDILLYDSKKNIENCFKMVLPSQTQIIAQRISGETKLKHDIVLVGETMGGGPCAGAVRRHIEASLDVFSTEKAALTLNDDINKIKEMGVVIVSEDEANELNAIRIEMRDVDKPALGKALGLFGISLPDNFAVAVQDHGYSPLASNRIFRFEYFRDAIEKGGALNSFVYKNNIPERFSRMKAVERTLPGALLMDTGIAAIRGALLDEDAKPPYLVVNIGNGHTLAGIVDDGRLLSLFEHHTHQMTANKLDDYLKRLCSGALDSREILDDGGHGCYIGETVDFGNLGSILVTGPRRGIMRRSKLDIMFAAPFGDMMLTGCFGLMDAYLNYIPDQIGDA
ncbi:MAG: DUF1786 domain-containing protein [Candidatus Methanoperedens sp.]|nr:DUF1786 domain-containing protein [Candidatus Methanoperedens sp.]